VATGIAHEQLGAAGQGLGNLTTITLSLRSRGTRQNDAQRQQEGNPIPSHFCKSSILLERYT
jgi:hypothetical protein